MPGAYVSFESFVIYSLELLFAINLFLNLICTINFRSIYEALVVFSMINYKIDSPKVSVTIRTHSKCGLLNLVFNIVYIFQ